MGLASCHQNRFTWHANLSSARSDNGVGWAIRYTSTYAHVHDMDMDMEYCTMHMSFDY